MKRSSIRTRLYGRRGPLVVLLHGGPGAPGYMITLARELAGSFRVMEPLQRASGGQPLTVARHIHDLHDVIREVWSPPVALAGHSWGAMLALAYAAAHPHDVTCLALIGCGTFDATSRARLQAARADRSAGGIQQAIDAMLEHLPDPDARLREMGNLLLRAYSVDPIVQSLDLEACDAAAYEQTWSDMLRLQEAGTYPAAFEAISCPAIMLHGASDPHPGRMTWETLMQHMPHLEYREWERCGHYPWLEGSVREEFVMVLRLWLERHAAAAASGTRP